MAENTTPMMVRMNRQHRYASVGACIYCGKAAESEEHIIPRNLGGMLVLPDSSCGTCSAITSAFEGHLANSIYKPVRRQLRFPTRKPKKPKPPMAAEIDGVHTILEDKDFPGLLMAFSFPPPSILDLGPPATENLGGGVAIKVLPEFGERLNRVRRGKANQVKFTGATIDTTHVGRLLAKIAHGYAVAELGVSAFKPLLLDIIKDPNPTYIGHYVGGAMALDSAGADLHEVHLDTFFDGTKHVVVSIRLFANYGLPTYWVVAGERF